MLLFIVVFSLAFSGLSFAADTWTYLYGGSNDDRAWTVARSRDGGFLIGGGTTTGATSSLILKLSGPGKVLWQRKFQPGYVQTAQQTADDGYILSGRHFITKIAVNGTHEWLKTYGKNEIRSVRETKDHGFLAVGRTAGSFDSQDFWIAKLNINGSIIWQKKIGGTRNDVAYDFIETADQSYIIVGRTYSLTGFSVSPDILAIELSKTGSVLWKRIYDTGPYDVLLSTAKTSDGGFVLSGSNSPPAFVLKLDRNGKVQWSKSYNSIGGLALVGLNSIQQIPGGGFVALYAQNVIKLNAVGNFVAARKFFAPGIPHGQSATLESIRPVKGGGFIVAGRAKSSDGSDDFFVMRLNNDMEQGIACVQTKDFELTQFNLPVKVGSSFPLQSMIATDIATDPNVKTIVSPVARHSCP